MVSVSLLLFDSFSRRDAFRGATALCAADDHLDAQYILHETRVEPHSSPSLSGGAARRRTDTFLGVVRARNIQGFMHKASSIITAFSYRFAIATVQCFVFNSNASSAVGVLPEGTQLNAPLEEVAQRLGLALVRGNDAVAATMRRAFPVSPMRLSFVSLLGPFGAEERNEPEGVGIVFGPEGAEDDPDFTQAARASLLSYERERAQRRPAPPTPLKRTWADVLRTDDSEAPTDGDPLCCVCLEARASICLVNCGHQCLCDGCVREIWTRSDVAHACPVCRVTSEDIVRPIVPCKKRCA